MSRLKTRRAMYNDHPFTGDGYSLYATIGSTVQYRNKRLLCGNPLGTAELDFGATSVLKTARQGTIEAGGTWTIPAAYQSQTVTFDVRRYKDDVENATYNYRTATVAIDGSGDLTTAINGTGSLIKTEILAGGIVKIFFRYYRADNGVQPNLYRLTRTAGPTAPADVTVSRTIVTPSDVITFTTGALSDSSAYTFKIVAENDSTTKDLITGIAVTADATGPTAPSTATAEAW